MPLPLAETAKCIERASRHFLIKGHNDDPRILQQFVELTDRIRSEAREQNDPGFEDGDRGDQQLLAPRIAAWKCELSGSFVMR